MKPKDYNFISRKLSIEFLSIQRVVIGPAWSAPLSDKVGDWHHLYIVLEGESSLNQPGFNLDLKPGGIYLIPPVPTGRQCREFCDKIWMILRFDSLSFMDLLPDLKSPMQIGSIDIDDLPPGLLANKPQFEDFYYLSGLIQMCLTKSIPNFNERIMKSMKSYQQFQNVFDFVSECLSAELQVSELAEIQGMHRTAFARAFKASTGLSPKDFLAQELNKKACDLLGTTEMLVREIAAKLKFNDEFYFNKFFKKMNGTTPKKFRDSVKH